MPRGGARRRPAARARRTPSAGRRRPSPTPGGRRRPPAIRPPGRGWCHSTRQIRLLVQQVQAPRGPRPPRADCRSRAGLVDVAGGRDPLHHAARPAERRGGRPPPRILPMTVRSGSTPVAPAHRPGRQEAGDHLVEDQQRVVARTEVAQQLQKARRRAGSGPCSPGRARLDRRRELVLGEGLAASASASFQPTMIVWAATSAGTPGEAGRPAWRGRSPPRRAARRRVRGRPRRT